jgi:SAM-dependent methyltransferase
MPHHADALGGWSVFSRWKRGYCRDVSGRGGKQILQQVNTGASSVRRNQEMRERSLDRQHWASVAGEWIAWARTPNHDAFWAYRKALADFIGRDSCEVLDVGCGEGRVSRELKTLGYRVTACDPVAEFVEAAKEVDSAHDYAIAHAASLPFEAGRFPLVVAYNMLMDVEDVPAAVKEMRRVMRPNGKVMISIVHPLADHGRFDGTDPDAPFVLHGSYFGRQRFEGTEERNGLQMRFAGWSQPLQAYVAALENAGLAITSLREPVPAVGDEFRHVEKWTRLPLFLWLKAQPLAR